MIGLLVAVGLFSFGYVDSELPAEPVAESHPYMGTVEMDAAVLDILDDENTCPQFAGTALVAGWQADDLPRLLRIMWRESRCIPTACGETDSPHIRKCRDWGLMQINDYSWKRIIREMGWDIEQMHDPLENLRFSRWLFEYSLERNGDGWHPWRLQKQ